MVLLAFFYLFLDFVCFRFFLCPALSHSPFCPSFCPAVFPPVLQLPSPRSTLLFLESGVLCSVDNSSGALIFFDTLKRRRRFLSFILSWSCVLRMRVLFLFLWRRAEDSWVILASQFMGFKCTPSWPCHLCHLHWAADLVVNNLMGCVSCLSLMWRLSCYHVGYTR